MPTGPHIKIIDITGTPYRAIGDGVHDCTVAIGQAVDEVLQSPGGAIIEIPRGMYKVNPDARYVIPRSNVTVRGRGPDSVITIPEWRVSESNDPLFWFSAPGTNGYDAVENDVVSDFRVVSVYGRSTPVPGHNVGNLRACALVQYGGYGTTQDQTERTVIHRSGARRMVIQGFGGTPFAFSGGSQDWSTGRVCYSNFVEDCIVAQCGFTAINAFSFGHRGVRLIGNDISGCYEYAIEWAGQEGNILGNVIRDTGRAGLALLNVPTQDGGMMLVQSNSFAQCGAFSPTVVQPTVLLGTGVTAVSKVLFGRNAIYYSFGGGIYAAPGSSDLDIVSNRILEFGKQATGKTAAEGLTGISVDLATRAYVRGNQIVAGSEVGDVCNYGLITGLAGATDVDADDNTILGTYVVAPAVMRLSAGRQGAGVGLSVAGTRLTVGENRGPDGNILPPRDSTNAEYIPALATASATPSAVGYDTYRMANAAPQDVTNITGVPRGRRIVVIFEDANSTLKQTPGGSFKNASGADVTPAAGTTRTYISDGTFLLEAA